MISTAGDLRSLFISRDKPDSMVEDARQQVLLATKVREVRRLPCRLYMASPFVVAGDPLRLDQMLQAGDGVERCGEQLSRAGLAESCDERRGIESQPGD